MITNGAAGHENANNCITSVCTEPSLQGPQTETLSDSSVATATPSRTTQNRRYYLKNRTRIIAQTREYALSNPQRSRKYYRESKRRRRLRMIEDFGGKCAQCSCADPDVLDLDHVQGDGCKQRAKGLNSYSIYTKIRTGELCRDDYRLLCRNCNWKAWLNSLRGRVNSSV